MFYINTETLEYPIQEGAIRALFSNTSFPFPFIAPEPYALVQEVQLPEFNRLRERIVTLTPEIIDGVWHRRYEVLPLAPEIVSENEAQALQQQGAQVRANRNQLLQQSDWTQVIDAKVNQIAWATYRQALRDITSQPGFPWEIIWPTQP
jgi:hypothetical protein